MKTLFTFLKSTMKTPTNFGWFHLLSVVIVIIVTTLLIIKFKDCSDKTFRRIALICWLIMFFFELYKQIVFTYSYTDSGLDSDYSWYAFPYQLCSTPLYILPIIAIMKESKIREFFVSYISTFALFGGLVVFFYPNDVFTSIIGINIQTMTHHGLQIITGIFFAVHQRRKANIKYFLKSIPVFVVLLIIAIALNESVYAILLEKGLNDTFNMFYISRHFANHLPILSTIYQAVPYLVFLLSYTFGFMIASLIVYYTIVGIIKLVYFIKKKSNAKN